MSKPKSAETRAKMSIASKGRKQNSEVIKRRADNYRGKYIGVNNPNFGKKRSPETIAKMVENKKRNKQERLTMIF